MSSACLLCTEFCISHAPSPSPATIPILKLRKSRQEIKTSWHAVQESMGKELAFKTRTQTQIQQLTAASHISLVLADGTSGYSSKHRREAGRTRGLLFLPWWGGSCLQLVSVPKSRVSLQQEKPPTVGVGCGGCRTILAPRFLAWVPTAFLPSPLKWHLRHCRENSGGDVQCWAQGKHPGPGSQRYDNCHISNTAFCATAS